jgi:glucosamine--fructose-6-phosphate aminotransferase (isomerizing)
MCGIIGYIGKKNNPEIEKQEIFYLKSEGKISELEKKFSKNPITGNPSIFHTRWATHGQVNEANAHPQWDCDKNIFLVHNGIIENYKELKQMLISEGHKFESETDTEVLAHLIERYFEDNLEQAVRKALKKIHGSYALAVIARKDPNKIVVARLSSPLIIGLNKDEYWVASDPNAIAPYAQKIITLEDNEIATITQDDISVLKEKQFEEIETETEEVSKADYPHYMLKEIMEQPESVGNTIKGRLIIDQGLAKLGGLEQVKDKLKEVERINIVACGTARHAGLVGEYMLEEYAGIPVEVEAGSEFRYRKPILDKKTVVLAVSQSGETADTLAAIKEAKQKNIMTLGMVNVAGTTITRETDSGVYNHAGSEIGVASTKAFTSQLTVFALMTLFFGRQRNMSLVMGRRVAQEISQLPELIKKTLDMQGKIKELVEKYKNFNNFMYIGRKYNYPIALEGALKLKEISYVHAEGIRSGELKHGSIALIDENFPTIAICPTDSVYEKMVSNIEEVKARKGPVIAIATQGNEEIKNLVDDVIYIPKTLEMLTPILSVIPLQLFAYHFGVLRGCDVDKPRNLAKSVTVE